MFACLLLGIDTKMHVHVCAGIVDEMREMCKPLYERLRRLAKENSEYKSIAYSKATLHES